MDTELCLGCDPAELLWQQVPVLTVLAGEDGEKDVIKKRRWREIKVPGRARGREKSRKSLTM